ncbi:MAG: ECF-type sigma factor [Pirellulales bacterium]
MSDPRSVTGWIAALKSGDEQAARDLWQRYFDALVKLARQRLDGAPRRVADEEDVALSVFRCLCDGAVHGRLARLSDRGDLWRLLVIITTQKAIDQQRRWATQRRGGGNVRGDSVFAAFRDGKPPAKLDQIVSDEPTPELLALLAEQHQLLLQSLADETLRRTALLRMEGQTIEEIAQQLGITPRSVERKLQRIRSRWNRELRP